ncbi:serine/threonine protein kinase [Ktedonosporobacter rubrisoli]|uniref:Serine/threonine protein kinase n=1 Tax=Ktedonosporobacter rubrisoli TaxID=2509675 RepID=A0A4P6K2F0_KTERU|nr:serine/threonine-protein kinase [Ktedonosporobacter rubrisoli]QBD82185.1 serine/threonine protein kinase [Ktedonosporobacter rubrisoli]
MREVQTKLPKGRVVRNRYLVEDLLGKGGFGAVYRVRDRRVKGNVFALKELIDPNAYQRAGFAFECELLKRLDHYALPRVYRVFEDAKNSRVYMLMDYIDGPNLERLRLQQPEKRFPLSQVMKIMAPVIHAIDYLHTQQPPIIHRDIKPSNIIVPTTGEEAVLVDFGIAKEYEQDSTTTAIRHCSPGYGAPEHYVSGTNTRTDIYSLAATFYVLLSGTVPVDALHRMTRISSEGSDPLKPVNEIVEDVPAPVGAVLQKAMSINSNDRFATAPEFWRALKAACPEDEEPASATPAEPEASTEAASEADAEKQNPSAQVENEQQGAAADQGVSAKREEPLPEEKELPVRGPSRPQPGGKGRLIALVCVALSMIALISGLLWGWSSWTAGDTATAVSTPIHTAGITPTTAAAPTSQPTATPTPSPTPSPSPTQAPTYPALVANYGGHIHNTPANVDSSMSISKLQQKGEQISGYLTLGPGLLGSGNFTGTVSTDRKIQFSVPGYANLLPLNFQGTVQADGNMSGTYCSYQNGQCDQAGGGYGSWTAAPQS